MDNLLPQDGEVYYHPTAFHAAEIETYFQRLHQEIPWEHDEVFLFGKRYITGRKVAWFAKNKTEYAYSGTKKQGLEWTDTLESITKRVESITGQTYNACLLNYYAHGKEGMGWHADNESSRIAGSSIASISFGAARRFDLKHRETNEKISIWLESGSLLDMTGKTQDCWLHTLPKSSKIDSPRINLTFRLMAE